MIDYFYLFSLLGLYRNDRLIVFHMNARQSIFNLIKLKMKRVITSVATLFYLVISRLAPYNLYLSPLRFLLLDEFG